MEGTMEDYLQCKECENARSRLDYYYDVQLAVKGFDSIQSSLAAYTQPELLCGDNQYFCDNCNKKVDALKGLRFREFPYYLVLQLKRFDYDWSTLQRIKLNNRVSFPITLDMSPFLYTSSSESPSPSSTDSSKYMYQLCSVLIASGGAMGGHYFAYIYSFERKKWYNFNDTTYVLSLDSLLHLCVFTVPLQCH
jgi:ubiquitin carboxyl-terminal hydrolase 47